MKVIMSARSIGFLGVVAMLLVFAPWMCAQNAGRAMNYNTHEGKYESGGFGAGLILGFPLSGSIFRGGLVTPADGIPVLANQGAKLDRSDSAYGIGFDFQFGSNNDTIGTNVGLDLISHSVEATDANGLLVTSFAETAVFLSFDFIINFYKSEFLEPDGRRTRDNFNLSLIVGPKIGMLTGDLADVGGLASFGLEFGLAADFPVHKDFFQVAPSLWFEFNYHMSADAESTVFNSTDTGLLAGGTGNNDGVLVRQHTIIPSWALNLGSDFIFTPLFVGQEGALINNWRFVGGLYFTVPFTFNAFAASAPGDPLYTEGDGAAFATIVFSASYFW